MKKTSLMMFVFLGLLASVPIASTVLASEEKSVEAAYRDWRNAMSSGSSDAVVQLYDKNGILHATFHPEPLVGHDLIRPYFVKLTGLPKLGVEPIQSIIRIYGDTAINTGTYKFSYEQDGKLIIVPARFSFTYRKDEGKWKIVDHHSSLTPEKK
jgi:hypothetical protein